MRKICIIILTLILLMTCFAGCVNEKDILEKRILVGFAVLDEQADFSQWVKAGVKEATDEKGFDLITVDNRLDGRVAVENTDLLIARGVDIVIMYQADERVAPVIMEKLNAANIPVVAIDIFHEGAVFFGGNNLEAGKIAGRALAQKAIDEWDGEIDLYISLEAKLVGEANDLRMQGFIDGIRELIDLPDEKIVVVDGKNRALDSKKVATDALTANPDAKRILIGCLQDLMTQGALAAVETSGRQDQVFIAGQGPYKLTLENLRGEPNSWIGSTSFRPEAYGEYTIDLCARILAGEDVPQYTYPEHYFLTYDNVDEYYPE